jgi:hypothetical protein
VLPVVVGSHPNSPWLEECVDSIRATTKRRLLIHYDGGYEPAALRFGCSQVPRFVFIQDSVRILSPKFWEAIGTEPAWLSGWPPMFMGIHESAQLLPHLPTGPVSKEDTIMLEAHLGTALGYRTIWPQITDHTALRTEHLHGRDNLVLGNRLWEKFKGTHR